ncbi:hypothetical protein MKW94_014020 [Papaver nudicaule]|uniref:Uncharacterized protein n=1 Tax=Papaver nudicaule TaxID=74823 RepID=A0AA41W2J6_PAPNU|nr:hypothetical protein [Papaver nudicaule]
MAKLFCASLILVAAYILLLITVSVSSGDAQATCGFQGGYIGVVKVATSKISCPSCKSGCLRQCGRSKYTTVHDKCDTIAGATLQCYCCCSNIQKPSLF